jgi:hypothetical protein
MRVQPPPALLKVRYNIKMDNETFKKLLASGAIELIGYDDEQNEIYRITPAAQNIDPFFWEAAQHNFGNQVFSLWCKGFLELDFDKEGIPQIGLTEESEQEWLYEYLEESEVFTLRGIIERHKELDKQE